MTYLEYAKIVCPEKLIGDEFVSGCPEFHGLPRVPCEESGGDCVLCYRQHIVPDYLMEQLMADGYDIPGEERSAYEMETASDEDILNLLGGKV